MKLCQHCGTPIMGSAAFLCSECGNEIESEKEVLEDVEKIEEIPIDDYDGYYDDIESEDNGYIKEKIDPELVKRIAIIAGVTIVIIILAILVMNLL